MRTTLTEHGERLFRDAYEGLMQPPWWWQAAGKSEADWEADQRLRYGTCRRKIHDQPLYCERVLTQIDTAPVAVGVGTVPVTNVYVCRDDHYNVWMNNRWYAFDRAAHCVVGRHHEAHLWTYRHAPSYPATLYGAIDFTFLCSGEVE